MRSASRISVHSDAGNSRNLRCAKSYFRRIKLAIRWNIYLVLLFAVGVLPVNSYGLATRGGGIAIRLLVLGELVEPVDEIPACWNETKSQQ